MKPGDGSSSLKGSLGEREDFLRSEEEREAREAQAESEQHRKAQDFLVAWTRRFECERPNIGKVAFVINLKNGRIVAKAEDDREWSLLEGKYAVRWLNSATLKARDPNEYDSFPAWFFDETPPSPSAHRVLWRARWRWQYRKLVQGIELLIGGVWALIVGIFFVLIFLICAGLFLYGVYYIAGGINGLLEFGWKNMK